MDINDSPFSSPIKRKPGPKPQGDRALTPAQKSRRNREKKRAEGSVEFLVTLARGKLAFIDRLADAAKVSRSKMLEILLDNAILNVATVVVEGERAAQNGLSDNEIRDEMEQQLSIPLAPELIDRYKELLDYK